MSLFDSSPDSGNNDPSQSFWGDPGNQAAFGALAGILQAGTTPRFAPNGWGIKGGGALNALAALSGAGMAGAVKGAGNAQEYQSEALANQNSAVMNPISQQTAQLGLQKQQALQPMQIAMIKNYMGGAQGGSVTSAPFGMPQASTPGQQILSQANPASLTEADGHFSQALDFAMAQGDMTQASKVQQSWAEHSPALAGAIAQAQKFMGTNASGSIVPLPGAQNATQQMAYAESLGKNQGGITESPGGPVANTAILGSPPAFGSYAPPMQSAAPQSMQSQQLPPPPAPSQVSPQPAQAIPPINASQLQPPMVVQPASVNPLNAIAVGAAKDAAAEKVKNSLAIQQGTDQMLSRMPSVYNKLDGMDSLAPNTLSGPGTVQSHEGKTDLGPLWQAANLVKDPKAGNTAAYKNLNDQLFVNEIPALMNNASGMKLDIPLVKGVQSASGVPLEVNADGKQQIQTQLRQNFKDTIDTAMNNYKAQTGQDYDLTRQPWLSTPQQVKQAYAQDRITKSQVASILKLHPEFKNAQ